MKNNIEKIIAPLIVLPLSYLGAVIINGSHPETLIDFAETILFISIISLPVAYAGMFLIVLPLETALINKYPSSLILILLCSIIGGTIFTVLDLIFVPGHNNFELSQLLFVFPMGAVLGLSVSLSYVLISGITNRLSSPVKKHGLDAAPKTRNAP